MAMSFTIGSVTAWNGWTTNSTFSATVKMDPWLVWTVDCGTTTTASVKGAVTAWVEWTVDYGHGNWAANAVPARSEEELQREREEAAARMLAQEQKDEDANRRALLLLMAILSKEQREEYYGRKQFHVSARSGRRYRVSDGSHGNLSLVDEHGNVLKKLCVQPTGIPKHDVMAGQALHLMDNEEEFVRRANVTCIKAHKVRYGGEDPDYQEWFAAEKEAVA